MAIRLSTLSGRVKTRARHKRSHNAGDEGGAALK